MADLFGYLRSGKLKQFLRSIDSAAISQCDDLGRSLLHVAIAQDQDEAAIKLISAGADVNLQDAVHHYSPLHVAAEYGNLNITVTLLENGADPALRDKHGNSPLWTAVFWSQKFPNGQKVVKSLLEAGGDPLSKNKAGRSPLEMAERLEDDELVQLLKGSP